MINKLQLLFSVNDPENRDKISTILLNNWSLINKKKLNINHRLAIRVNGDPTSSVPQDGQPDNLPEQPSFDVMFEIRGEDIPYHNLVNILDGFTKELEPLINKNNSAAIVGTEYKLSLIHI